MLRCVQLLACLAYLGSQFTSPGTKTFDDKIHLSPEIINSVDYASGT